MPLEPLSFGMARAPKLKVFRMAIGFHDAFVAAPSQKAAAEAWGSDTAVFSRGEAELVTDPKLTEEPLAKPGKVIKRLRGTAEEQIAALGPDEIPKRTKPAKPPSRPKPRPSRAALEEAELEMEAAKARFAEVRADLAEREAELERERKALEAKERGEMERLEARREEASALYEEAMRRWRG
jgi:hypothetical protein